MKIVDCLHAVELAKLRSTSIDIDPGSERP